MKEPIGALWLKTSQKGKKYFSGTVEVGGTKLEIVIFRNDKGGVETRPDYRIFPSERLDRDESVPQPAKAREVYAPPPKPPQTTLEGGFDDDVSF